MKKIINCNNKYRVVLTEVLPYETPFLFSNKFFYEILSGESKPEELFKDIFRYNSNKYSIPFEYSVRRKGANKSRTLSIIHPAEQIKISSFYRKYGDYLIYLNGLSPFSLRHISSEKKSFSLANKGKDKYQEYDSYFNYQDYNRGYLFFESTRFLHLEQKFLYERTLDIEKCFYHIYTHSFSWAVRGKEAIKESLSYRDQGNTCEADFDSLMMSMNYQETNGIVVGPEFSRIFAEVILQRIDLKVLTRLKSDHNLVFGQDYEVKSNDSLNI